MSHKICLKVLLWSTFRYHNSLMVKKDPGVFVSLREDLTVSLAGLELAA